MVIGLRFGKVVRASAALVGKEDAVESVVAHIAPIDVHYMRYTLWNSVPYTGFRN